MVGTWGVSLFILPIKRIEQKGEWEGGCEMVWGDGAGRRILGFKF
jgi:hypothetical protein